MGRTDLREHGSSHPIGRPIPLLLVTGLALLAMALLARAVWALESARRLRLASQHFCTCPDCRDLAVWSEQADDLYGVPLNSLLGIDVVLRLASGVAIGAGLIAVIGGWLLARLARDAGVCPTCRYDRTGLPASVVCPECGSAPPESSAHGDTASPSA